MLLSSKLTVEGEEEGEENEYKLDLIFEPDPIKIQLTVGAGGGEGIVQVHATQDPLRYGFSVTCSEETNCPLPELYANLDADFSTENSFRLSGNMPEADVNGDASFSDDHASVMLSVPDLAVNILASMPENADLTTITVGYKLNSTYWIR